MSISSDIPQIAALRNKVEEFFGKSLVTHTDFLELVDSIEKSLKEHVSESTLERLWGYSTRENKTGKVSIRTLNVLSRLCGFSGWEDFCAWLKAEQKKESELFTGKVLRSVDLEEGARLLIGWQPDRLCTVRYLGDNLFEVESVENTSLSQGDRFKVIQFQLGRPLYLEEFCSASSATAPGGTPHAIPSVPSSDTSALKTVISGTYAVGQEHGLTTLKLL